MDGFVARHGLWTDDKAKRAREIIAQVERDGIEQVRLSFTDVHGLLRGKTLLPSSLASVFADGCAVTSTLLLKDTAHRTVAPIFTAGAGIGEPQLQGGGDVVMVPDPSTFRRLPWVPKTGWLLCDLYYPDGRPVPLSTRRIAQEAHARLADRGFTYVSGLEVEFHLTRLVDCHLGPDDAGQPGQPGTPPAVALLHQGYAYLTEQRFDQIEPVLDILRRDCLALDLPLHSLEIEFGPSQCEFVFRPQEGIRSADDMVVFRNAAKQIARRHGYHASFMCRPHWPSAMSSGWHLHQSLRDAKTGANRFANKDGGPGLSQTGRHFLAGLLASTLR